MLEDDAAEALYSDDFMILLNKSPKLSSFSFHLSCL